MCFDIYLHGEKLSTIEADSYDKAFNDAVRLYGLEIDLKEILCKHQMSYN